MEAEKKQEQTTELLERLIGNLYFCFTKLKHIQEQDLSKINKKELEKELTVIGAVISTTLMELGKLMYLLLGE